MESLKRKGFIYVYINRKVRGYSHKIINIHGTLYMELPKSTSTEEIYNLQKTINL